MEQENKKVMEPFSDEWLTQALRARSQAEARPGLEERILARLASEVDVRPQQASTWRWMSALAVAFGLLLIVLIGREFLPVKPRSYPEQAKRSHPTREAQPLSSVPEAPNAHVTKADRNVPKHSLRAPAQSSSHPVVAKANALPKLDKFPAETSASEQEKLMAEIQRRQFTAALAQYARDFREGKDLVIENNSIPPLSPETADEKPNR